MTYDPLTYETDWMIGTAEKGTRYAIRRAKTGGEVALLPYGLRPEEKALAVMVAATPQMVAAIRSAITLLTDPEAGDSDAARVLDKLQSTLAAATYTRPETV